MTVFHVVSTWSRGRTLELAKRIVDASIATSVEGAFDSIKFPNLASIESLLRCFESIERIDSIDARREAAATLANACWIHYVDLTRPELEAAAEETEPC